MLFLRARFIHDLHAVKLRVRKLAVRRLSVSCAQLLDEGRIYLYFDALHIYSLGFVPTTHLGQHLRGFEAIGCARL